MTTETQVKHATAYFGKAASAGSNWEFVLSLESEDRAGDIIKSDGWELSNFRANPVMLWAHESGSLPIGKWVNVRVEGKELRGTAIFDLEEKYAQMIAGKVRLSVSADHYSGLPSWDFDGRQSSQATRCDPIPQQLHGVDKCSELRRGRDPDKKPVR